MKAFLLTCCIALIAIALHAQDKIYKRDGTVFDVKVKAVREKTVLFNRADDIGGTEYSVPKRDVAKIVYQNGSTDVFAGSDKTRKNPNRGEGVKSKYGKNIISVTPLAYTASLDGTINDEGIGLTYERILDQHGHISINIPVMLSFSSDRDYYGYSYYNNGVNVTYGTYTSFYFMPGVKFYPARYNERVKYSLGASFFCIFGGEPYATYGSYNAPSGSYNYAMYGFMITNSINITATKHLYMGLDLSAGIPFSDNRLTYQNDEGLGIITDPFIQFSFKVGYRY